MIDKNTVVEGVAEQIVWWLKQREIKLSGKLADTMTINPFLMPAIFDLHYAKDFPELISILLAGHLMNGHNTGFGKLMDEKILPLIFRTHKLDKKFRSITSPCGESCFDEIDHLVPRDGTQPALLSLKSGRWTIQLTMAVQLNKAFSEIITRHDGKFSEIVVGVLYGTKEGLTDKYDILRGINRGANHDVIDVQDHVRVLAGREFWTWINNGQPETQDWVMTGILKGLKDSDSRAKFGNLLDAFTKKLVVNFDKYIDGNGKVDWLKLLADING